MGCAGSKEEEAPAPRARADVAQRAPAKQTTQPMSTGAAQPSAVGIPTAMSYSDERLDEADYFKKLVEDTEGRFIQVAPSAAPLSTGEAKQREQTYHTQVEAGRTQKSSLVFAMPTNPFPMIRALAQHANTISDQQFMKQCSQSVLSAYQGIALKQGAPLVEHMPEIDV
eukprot:TRINITY_DN368_c0_g1_i2.p1 TRINITY_DN368_c0_g1~~TRINITY_DN368_c0_g1_i2.p1  ORF type:complete len:169 (+),score=23.79 TRINITY_DN368_c0_g1_i2:36-542(+)